MTDTHGRITRDIPVDGIAHAFFLDQRLFECVAGKEQLGRSTFAFDIFDDLLGGGGFDEGLAHLRRAGEGRKPQCTGAQHQCGALAGRYLRPHVESAGCGLARTAQFAPMLSFAAQAFEKVLRFLAPLSAQRRVRPVHLVERTIEFVQQRLERIVRAGRFGPDRAIPWSLWFLFCGAHVHRHATFHIALSVRHRGCDRRMRFHAPAAVSVLSEERLAGGDRSAVRRCPATTGPCGRSDQTARRTWLRPLSLAA